MLVDTSVWIDHFRRDRSDLRASLEAGEVVCHPFVVGELACGTFKKRDEVLSLLAALEQVTVAEHTDVMHLLERHQLMGRGLGWIDAHLLASARLNGETLWTLDGALRRSARIVGVSLVSLMLCSAVIFSAPQKKTELGGRVLNGLTHQRVRGAIVTMRVPLEGPFSESEVGFLTGADGRFTFIDPPRKSVEVSVTKTGWVRPTGHDEPRVVNLANQAQALDDLELELWPEARLEGRAFEPSGQPASKVDLLIQHDGGGGVIPAPRTDGEGYFSVGGLQPGKYDVDGLDPSGTVSLAVGEVRHDLIVRIAAARLVPSPLTSLLFELPHWPLSANVSGVVVDPAGNPIRGAHVTAFSASNGGGMAQVITRSDGSFELEIGPYAIDRYDNGVRRADVNLYAEPAASSRRPGDGAPASFALVQMPEDVRPTAVLHVEMGQQIDNMVLRIGRGSAITGRVTDVSGDPIAANVSVVQSSRGINGLTQAFVDTTSTDSAGRYRISGLREGTYQILAQPADYPSDLHAADASGVHRRIAFLDTYYPSVQGPTAAFPVILTSESLITGIDVHVAATPVTSIEVRAVASKAITDVRLAIRSLEDADAPWRTLPWDTERNDGVAVIDRITAGRHAIAASANVTDSDNARSSVLRGLVEISSDGLTAQPATITLGAGATLSGHVVFDGSHVVPAPRVFVRLAPFPTFAAPPIWGPLTRTDAAGEFAITNIAPGQYRLETADSRWLMRSATLAGRDVLDSPIDLVGGVDYGELVLTYTDRTATITGSVTGRSSSSARVLVSPTDRRLWANPNRVQVLTIVGGTYASGPLLAGEYFVIALESADLADLPELLHRSASLAARVSVAEGARRVQNLVVR